ncbi:hypothetical protein HMPREF1617_05317 [Escherichia coli 908675]|nr:hypothetical protein UTI89_C0408 [Escherichia coli UTI89]EFJ58765.1 hypothetical protein HMPREF9553_05237 [Escherichia coli MS 200-1]EFU49289.1 hypothetical protein HMPREF9539_00174 [Escherichia coli MS 110-3]EGB79917.1 hypothetical protein HMPREF9533_05295 [Escherichia coli MS 60-1]ESE07742.1 hypothetical protein HMPREF1617_05317 [Escherichia coli 908675]
MKNMNCEKCDADPLWRHSESLPSSLMRSLFVRVLIAFFRIHRFLSGRMFTDQRVWFRMIGSELVPGYRLSWLSFINRHYICFTRIRRFRWHRSSLFHGMNVKYRRSKINN